ncbi:MAG: BatA and WFA domain-containing protein [Candidatus Zixiibacteriota bacterium]|nr:MAG: BatA and WFA domain-containing protein [candidate division Zixibacteria bacterium]
MFSFLNSTFLLAGVAALIPLIIHLLSRRRRKVVEFSSLRHLKAMQRRQVRRLQLRQLLLLIIRMLIILMVVLAFARPTFREGGAGSHASVSAVIILDNSASMERYVKDGKLLDIALKRTRQLLENFGQSDRVCLLPLSRPDDNRPADFTSAAVALAQLEIVQPYAGAVGFSAALEAGADMLRESADLNREMYIVTDRQRRLLPEKAVLDASEVRLCFVDLPAEEIDNRGITAVSFGGQLIQPGHDFDLVAAVKNYGPRAVSDLIASCCIDDRRVSQVDFALNASGESTVRFTRSVLQTGFHSGYIEISDDSFLPDNRYYFSFHIPDQFNVLVISDDEAAGFVSLALVPEDEGQRYWSVKEAGPTDLTGVNIYDYDLLLLIGAPDLPDPYARRVASQVRRGTPLFVTYGGETDIQQFNAVYSSFTGVTYGRPVREDFTRSGYYSLQSADLDHPIFSVFNFEDGRMPEIKFYTLPELSVSSDARVLMYFTGDRPALVETIYGSGKVITFTGPIAPYYGDLVSHAFFVPLVARTAEYLVSDLSRFDLQLLTDQNISRSLSLTGSILDPIELHTPDSVIFFVTPDEQQGNLVVRAEPTDRPGIYHLRYRGQEIDRFAVNVNPDECELQSIDPDQFATALGASAFDVISSDSEMGRAVAGFRIGRELWHIFLWIALALLAVEMILGRGAKTTE